MIKTLIMLSSYFQCICLPLMVDFNSDTSHLPCKFFPALFSTFFSFCLSSFLSSAERVPMCLQQANRLWKCIFGTGHFCQRSETMRQECTESKRGKMKRALTSSRRSVTASRRATRWIRRLKLNADPPQTACSLSNSIFCSLLVMFRKWHSAAVGP